MREGSSTLRNQSVSRRRFLRDSGFIVAALSLSSLSGFSLAENPLRPRFILLLGAVRARDSLHNPAIMPNLVAMSRQGLWEELPVPGTRHSPALRHLLATLDLRGEIHSVSTTEVSALARAIECPVSSHVLPAGPNPDLTALRLAMRIWHQAGPDTLIVRLPGTDIAHESFGAYCALLTSIDAKLPDVISSVKAGQGDIVIAAEMGRNRRLNVHGGLDHDDGSEEQRQAWVVRLAV